MMSFKKREQADQAMIGSDDAMAAGPLWGRMLIIMGRVARKAIKRKLISGGGR